MRFLSALSDLMVPVLIFYVVGLGLLMKQDVFGDFLNGAKDGSGGAVKRVSEIVSVCSIFVPRDDVTQKIRYFEV